VRGVSKQERERKARATAEILGLSEVVLRKPGFLINASSKATRSSDHHEWKITIAIKSL
jgi:hypothetical protein